MMSYSEKERVCEKEFEQRGSFWHLYTDGTQMGDIFLGEDEMNGGMMILAIAAALTSEVRIITFELMSNHVHMILNGDHEDCIKLFCTFKKRLKKWFQAKDRWIDWSRFEAKILKIDSLKALRSEIIYVNRNAFVANTKYTPFSYPWGGGFAYFSPHIYQLPVKRLKELGWGRARELTRYRDLDKITSLSFVNDVAFIPSFCSIDIGESMFHDARSYFYLLTRNAESSRQIAARLKDRVFLIDEEMYAVAVKCSEESYKNNQLGTLKPTEKINLAKRLHFEYNATKQQLRRILKLDIAVLNELFP